MQPDSPLLERQEEVDLLRAAFTKAALGAGRPILVEGPAGTGKSALLAEARTLARDAGLHLLTARGNELETEFGFGVLRQLLEDALASPEDRDRLLTGPARAAARALDPAGEETAGPAPPTAATLHAIHVVASRLADEAPILLLVDDLHWADTSSLRALSYLAGRIAETPIALVTAMRPREPDAPTALLDELGHSPSALRLPLEPLSTGAVTAIVRSRLPEADDEACRAFAAETAGNPLYVQELLRAVASDGAFRGQDPVAEIHALSLPSLGDRVTRRIERVDPDAGALTRAMAVMGEGGSLARAAELAGLSLAAAGEVAHGLRRIELLAAEDPHEFVHPLVRRAVYDSMPVTERDALHARASEQLRVAGAPPEVVAAHLSTLTPRGSGEVAGELYAAAEQALARAAPDEAVRLLRRALEEGASDPPPARILALLGSTEVSLWDSEAIPHLRRAIELTDDVDVRAATSVTLAEVLFLTGQVWQALDFILDAFRDLGDDQVDAAASLASIGLMVTGYTPAAAGRLQISEERLDELTTGPSWHSRALAAVRAGMGAHHGDDPDRVRALLDSALRGDQLVTAQGYETWGIAHVLIALIEIDEFDRGLEVCETLMVAARASGMVNILHAANSHRGWLLARRGDLGQAEEALRPALDMALSVVAPTVVASMVFYLQEPMMERPGLADVAAVTESIDPDQAGLAGTWMDAAVRLSRARLREAARDTDGALADYRAALEGMAAMGMGPAVAPVRSLLALALPPAAHGEAVALVDEELALARASGLPRPEGVALRAAGLLKGDQHGLEDLRQSATMLERAGARHEHARTLLALGAAERRHGRRAEAREILGAALETAHACGAERLGERVREELNAAGGRPRRVATTGVEALTASELRVARLAARGASNREIADDLYIGLKTVETHLSHSYSKLGLAGQGSRDRLAEALDAS